MDHRFFVCFAWLFIQAVCSDVQAGEWTGFHGPLADVDGDRLPVQWSPTENIQWSSEITGYGQSSPVTWGDHVYVTSISGAMKERGHISAFHLTSGKLEWRHDFDTASQAENNNYVSKAAPSPVVDEGGLISLFEGGNLLAMSHDGQVLWKRNLIEDYGPIESRHGISASLEQTMGSVFVWIERSNNPYLLAIEKKSGKTLWKKPGLGTTSWATPRLVPVKSGNHLVLSGIGLLRGLDPETGEQLWQFDDIRGNSTPTPVPLGNGQFLIGATAGRGDADASKAAESNGLIAIEQTKDGRFEAKFVWRARKATSSFGSPLAHRGLAYFVNASGVLFCHDLASGEEKYSQRISGSVWATPIAVGNRIYLFSKNGDVSVIESGQRFQLLNVNNTWEQASPGPDRPSEPATRNFGGPVLYAAAIARNQVLIRRGDRLYSVSKK
ncbi:MAG: PQQ-binding-like beta-propeller repeat protein [Planctomycetaceae bacterium]